MLVFFSESRSRVRWTYDHNSRAFVASSTEIGTIETEAHTAHGTDHAIQPVLDKTIRRVPKGDQCVTPSDGYPFAGRVDV